MAKLRSTSRRKSGGYARNVQHRIVLIDGAELTRLMVRYRVGVRVDRTVTTKKIDEDFFIND
jgi:restriction system protein